MAMRPAFRWMLVAGIASLAAACAMAKSTPGEDPRTESTATIVKWTDGKDAISINCRQPGGCESRAVAMCNSTGGNYTVLRMDNMPTRGDMTAVRGAASVVIRCGS